MELPDLSALEHAREEVYRHMQGSPQLHWPLLSQRCGCEVWVKHENHNPTGAFKVRGGLVYIDRLRRREAALQGVATATRGNHGQSIAFAAARHGLKCLVVVPEGNNPEKNDAMRALGAELVVHGRDFDEAVPHARELAADRGWHMLPSFHHDLVCGVASYGLELLQARPQLDRIYVPIGLGSGICGTIAARDALGLATRIVGVASSAADCYARSLAAGQAVATESAETMADGMAVRIPNAEALQIMRDGVDHVLTVDDGAIADAMRHYFSDTHNIAEGAGAAPLAALLQEGAAGADSVALVLSGGNVDRSVYRQVLAA